MSEGDRREVAGLAVYARPARVPDRDAPTVVLVHGSLDRSASFIMAIRCLRGVETVRYDRRGYGRSSGAGVSRSIDAQVEDLQAVLDGTVGDRPCVLVGHSFGGVLVLTAAERWPERVASVAAFEAPMTWAPWWPAPASSPPEQLHPEDAAEHFMRRMIGDERWEQLPQSTRDARRSEGVVLLADYDAMHASTDAPFDLSAIKVPIIAGCGSASRRRHVESAHRLAEDAPDGELIVIDGAQHGGHFSHPRPFAAFVDRAVERAGR